MYIRTQHALAVGVSGFAKGRWKGATSVSGAQNVTPTYFSCWSVREAKKEVTKLLLGW